MEKKEYEELKARIQEKANKIDMCEILDYIKKTNQELVQCLNLYCCCKDDIENLETRLSIALAKNLFASLLPIFKLNKMKRISHDIDLAIGDF